MICQRCGHQRTGKPREVFMGSRSRRVCGPCANALDARKATVDERLADRERDRRRHNSERLAALEADGQARRERLGRAGYVA